MRPKKPEGKLSTKPSAVPINERQAKHKALLTAYDQLSSAPVSTFQPTQWTALIDHAIVDVDAIEFFFRDGHAISVDL